MIALPRFYDPTAVGTLRIERSALVTAEAEAAKAAGVAQPAAEDGTSDTAKNRERIAVFGIDVQVGFCHPDGSLFVPGAVDDCRRALDFFYPRLDRITTMFFSLDTHRIHQVFHPSFWVDAAGRRPAPFTPISVADVKAGRFSPVRDREACLEYVERLEAAGKYVLTIWPYHALLGGVSHALMPSVMELAMYHAVLRDAPTVFETKGENPLTENYSVLSPEVTELAGRSVGAFNATLFDAIMKHDRVYVFGQAKSHCVLSTLRDMRLHIERTFRGPKGRALASRVTILADCMSPVPPPPVDPLPAALDFPAVAERGLEELRAFGMNVVTTTDGPWGA